MASLYPLLLSGGDLLIIFVIERKVTVVVSEVSRRRRVVLPGTELVLRSRRGLRVRVVSLHPSVDRSLEVGHLEEVGRGSDERADRAVRAVLRQGDDWLERHIPANHDMAIVAQSKPLKL